MLWKMRVFVVVLVVVLLLLLGQLDAATISTHVYSLKDIFLPPTGLGNQFMPIRKEQLHDVNLLRFFLTPKPAQLWFPRTFEPSPGPSPSLKIPRPAAAPFSKLVPRHHHHHHRHSQRRPYVAFPPGPAIAPGCGQTCLDPLTSKPIGSPCGCVIPMKVRLLLNVAVYAVFAEVNELAIELAAGAFLKHSQVQIVGANADSQNQGWAVVDLNLVPLGNKFDNTTATLISDRFWRKDVPLNKTLFGSYEVVSITYPGIPAQPPSDDYDGVGPSGSTGDGEDPITARVPRTNYKMSTRTVLLIVFSAVVVCLSFFASVYIIINYRKVTKPSNAVGPLFTPSINRKTGNGYNLSSSVASSRSMSLLSSIPACALSMKTFSLAEMEKATENFSPRRVLGEGGFGRVYHGILEDGTEAAVKLLTRRDNQYGDRDFIAEVEILSRLHHRNLVKLIGICIEGQRRCLVCELVHNGSVESHLHGSEREKGALDWKARMKIAIGAARGLAYLHEDSNPRVIHRDFKASNVLLEDDFTPKVSDFGLAREATEGSHHAVSTRIMGTFGYVAPEYAMTGHLLVKSDVYSYGVMLLELLTGRKPVDMSQPHGRENLVTWARPHLTSREGIHQLVDPSLAGTCNFEDIAKVASIASMCVHPEVAHRPFMGEVVQALKLIYNDTDETCGDCASQLGSSFPDLDSDIGPSDGSWWNAGGLSPSFTYARDSAFINMDYSSGPLVEMENRLFSASSFAAVRTALPIQHGNRSGPLRTTRNNLLFNRLGGSMSDNGGLLPRQCRKVGFWV